MKLIEFLNKWYKDKFDELPKKIKINSIYYTKDNNLKDYFRDTENGDGVQLMYDLINHLDYYDNTKDMLNYEVEVVEKGTESSKKDTKN